MAKIKGSHNAMKSGMMAAEEIFAKFKEKDGDIGGLQLDGM